MIFFMGTINVSFPSYISYNNLFYNRLLKNIYTSFSYTLLSYTSLNPLLFSSYNPPFVLLTTTITQLYAPKKYICTNDCK